MAAPVPVDAPGPGTSVSMSRVVVVGLVAGFTSGLFGVGGGIVMVPALVLLAGFDAKRAVGTSLTAIVPISLAGAAGYALAGEVDAAYAALIALGALVGAEVGTRGLRRASGRVLQLSFAGLMLVTAVRLAVGGEGDGAGRVGITVAVAVGLVVLGVAAGVLAGLLGVGGGIIIVPVLTIVFGVPLVLAKGTSLLVIVPTAVLGTLRNRRSGLTDVRAGLAIGVAGVLSALAASQVSLGLDPQVSAILFAGLLVAAALRMARTARRQAAPA